MSGAGGERPLIRQMRGFLGGRMRRTGSGGGLSPPNIRGASRGDFRAVRGERVRRRPRPPGPRRGVRSRRGARIPRMPRQGAGENNRAQRNRESVFPPARPHSADSGEFKADALARRARQPVSTSYTPKTPCTVRRADGERTAFHRYHLQLPHPKAFHLCRLSH